MGRSAKRGSPGWARAGDWRATIYDNSLLALMVVIFLGAWLAQSVTAWTLYNDEQRDHGGPTVTWAHYLAKADFWEKTLQNWQSEFLAVGTMAIFTVYLRQRGSPESKPVGAAHEEMTSD